jgi:hypothetical protein
VAQAKVAERDHVTKDDLLGDAERFGEELRRGDVVALQEGEAGQIAQQWGEYTVVATRDGKVVAFREKRSGRDEIAPIDQTVPELLEDLR